MADNWTLATRWKRLYQEVEEACADLSESEANLLRTMLLNSIADEIAFAEAAIRQDWEDLAGDEDERDGE